MCGRFVRVTDSQQLQTIFELNDIPRTLTPQFNIAPTLDVLAVRQSEQQRNASFLRWGLIPSWARDEKIGYSAINARAETLGEKPAFRTAFRERRCLIIADGFFEWKKQGKEKLPHFFHMRDRRPFAFAGLWESWRGTSDRRLDPPLETCTIITTEPNELVSPLHDRMPAILRPSDYELWLDPEFYAEALLTEMLTCYPADEMSVYPVSTLVNRPANDGPECLERVATQQSLDFG